MTAMTDKTAQEPQQSQQRVGVKKKRWIVCFEHAILDLDLSIYEKMVYIVICSHAKKDGPAFPSVMTIAQEASCSRTKVFEALNTLEELGIITRENRIFPKRGQSSNLYEIEDIEPSTQSEGGNDNSSSPSVVRTPVFASRTAAVRHTDAPLDVLEQDSLNRVIEHKENTPLTPQGGHTDILDSSEPEPKKQIKPKEPGIEPKEPESMTQGTRDQGEFDIEPEPPERKPDPPAQIGTCPNPVLIDAILAAYNKILPELPAASRITPSREKTVKRRVREEPERSDPSWWERYFSRVREFPWLMGQNPSNWRACLDWLIGERGMLKVLEGGFGRFVPQTPDNGAEIGTDEGYELQRRFTDANGTVDAKALFRYLDSIETA